MNTKDFLTLLLVSFFWGGSFLFLRLLVIEGLDPLQIVSLRMMFAAIFIAPFFLLKFKKYSFFDHGFSFLLIGLLLVQKKALNVEADVSWHVPCFRQ